MININANHPEVIEKFSDIMDDFKEVDITVDTIIDPLKQDTLILRIFLEVEDEYGKVFNLAKVSSNVNSKTIRWANMNNYGDPDIFNQ